MLHPSGPSRRCLVAGALVLSLGFPATAASHQAAVAEATEDHFAIPPTDEGLPGAGPIRRYDWFQRLWRERRSAWAQSAERDRHAVVFLGDSITQGWGGGLGAAFPGIKVTNRGISGDTTRGVLIRLDEDVLAIDPTAVVLLIGTNDLEEGASPETIVGNVRLIVEALERHDPAMPIVVCQVFPSSATKKRPVEKIRAVNSLYLEAVKNDPRVTYLETWPLFADPNGDALPDEFPDLLHPNEEGYAKWAAALRLIFATLGLSETTPDPFTPEEGFFSLFNGRDLTGWGYRPTSAEDRAAAERWQKSDPAAAAWPFVDEARSFEGRSRTPDGRFAVIGGRLVVTTPPEYRKIQQRVPPGLRAAPGVPRHPERGQRRLPARAAAPVPGLPAGRTLPWAEGLPAAGVEPARGHRQGRQGPSELQRRAARGLAPPPGDRPDRRGGRPWPDGVPPDPDQAARRVRL